MMGQETVLNVLIAVAALYVYFIAKLLRGWRLFANRPASHLGSAQKIAVVVAFRNEAVNLPNLLASFSAMDYDKSAFEVLLIDDHSTDNSAELVKNWMAKSEIHAHLLSSKGEGKKAAQAEAISSAKFEIIACTDADCEVPAHWLRSINACFQQKEIALAFGPVKFGGKGFVLQKLEFVALIASTMAMLRLGWNVMGNAANMAVRKSVYFNAQKELQKVPSASGDDVFLLHHTTKNGGKISTFQALVTTIPQPTLKSFLQQRLRWAAKARYYKQSATIFVGALVLGINALLLAGLLALIFGAAMPWAFWFLLFVKCAMDFWLLYRSATFFSHRVKLHTFLFQECINVVYVPLVAVFSQLIPFWWKGRRY